LRMPSTIIASRVDRFRSLLPLTAMSTGLQPRRLGRGAARPAAVPRQALRGYRTAVRGSTSWNRFTAPRPFTTAARGFECASGRDGSRGTRRGALPPQEAQRVEGGRGGNPRSRSGDANRRAAAAASPICGNHSFTVEPLDAGSSSSSEGR
jgi:hypothetical protein